MRTAVTTLVLLSTLCVSTMAVPKYQAFLRDDKPVTPEEKEMDEAVQAARGFFLGFQQALYKTETVDENCLNKDAEGKILELFNAVFGGRLDITFIMKLVTDLMTITTSLQSCSTKSITDLASFCFFDGGNNCSPTKILDNVQKNLLIVMGKLTDLSAMVMQGLPKDPEQAYQMGAQAGNDLGSLVRVLLGFHHEEKQ